MTHNTSTVYVIRYTDTDGHHELIYRNPKAAADEERQLTDFGLNPQPLSQERFTHRRHNPQANPAAQWIDAVCPNT